MNISELKVLFSDISLYDTSSLQKQLEVEEHHLSDKKLLCLAYRKWGKRCPTHLDADFSFAIYDSDNKSYFCARDPLGIRALYFTKTKEVYSFSSNINDLLKLPGILKKPNLTSMSKMLYQRAVDYTETMYEGIYRLPPGHIMRITDGQEHIERYWYPENIKIDYSITEEFAAKKLYELLSRALDKRIFNLDETAFELSGGVDSSSVVSLLSQSMTASDIDSYSMDFEGLKCDESAYVNALLDTYSLHHQKIVSGKLDYHRTYSLGKLYAMSPNWPITSTFAMVIPMVEKMKYDGKNIIITGQGGDHLFTGTPYVLYDLLRRFKFIKFYRELRSHTKQWSKIKTYVLKPFLGKKLTVFISKLFRKEENDPFLHQDRQIENLSQRIGQKNPVYEYDLDLISSAGYSTIMDGNFFHCAEEYFDIEFRHPYFDLQLVEFALSLPPEMKYQKRTIKWILRKSMDGVLPDKIKNRMDKAEFSELIMQQIDAIDLDTLLNDPYIVKLGLIKQSLVNKHRKAYENKTVKYIVFLWSIINLEYWYRHNFEEESLIDL